MKNILKSEPIQLALAGILIIGFLYYLTRKTVSDVADSISNVNKGTPFEGFGPVGTLGNLVNTVSGGTLAAAGSKVADWFIPDPSPGLDIFYTVTFPDGSRHAVHNTDVDRNGYFLYRGARYRLAWDTSVPRKRLAVQVSS